MIHDAIVEKVEPFGLNESLVTVRVKNVRKAAVGYITSADACVCFIARSEEPIDAERVQLEVSRKLRTVSPLHEEAMGKRFIITIPEDQCIRS